jgi:hypothetical protein
MAFKKVTSLDVDKVYKIGPGQDKEGQNNPRKLEGYFMGSRTVVTDTGSSKIHVLQTPKGQIGFWGSADTNSKLAQVNRGTMVLVEFVEKRKLAGGKSKNIFDVSVDTDNTIEVAGATDSGVPEGTDDYQDNSDDSEDSYESVEQEYDSQPTAALQTKSAASRKAEVEAILKKGSARKTQ